ncbi:MAG: hypothetical protein U0T83_02860 [Bacteriovoracaceae bacterium]
MIGATIFAITTDLFPFNNVEESWNSTDSFAASQILGIPLAFICQIFGDGMHHFF